MSLADNLKELRTNRGMTQKQLAKATGLSIGTIQGYEQGRYEPNIEALESLAGALSCTFDDILVEPVCGTETDLLYWLLDEKIPVIQYEKVLENFNELNSKGRDKAGELVELLAKIPEYRKKDDAPVLNAAHDNGATPDQKKNADDIMKNSNEWN